MWSRLAAVFAIAFIPRVLGRKRVVASSVSRHVETTLRSRILMWTKMRRLYPELAPAPTVNALLAPTYLHLGYVLLQKGRTRESRQVALKSFGLSSEPHLWFMAASLIVFTCIGKASTDFLFSLKRRLVGRQWSNSESELRLSSRTQELPGRAGRS